MESRVSRMKGEGWREVRLLRFDGGDIQIQVRGIHFKKEGDAIDRDGLLPTVEATVMLTRAEAEADLEELKREHPCLSAWLEEATEMEIRL